MKCDKCKHWILAQNDVGMSVKLGNCRRYPPAVVMTVQRVKATPTNPEGMMQLPGSYFPIVPATETCGEFTNGN